MNVDRDVIRAKLRALADHVARVEQKRPASLAQLRAVETAGEAFAALAELQLLDAALATKLVQAVGFRNVSVHEYVAVDWSVVMHITESGIRDLKEFGKWAASLVA